MSTASLSKQFGKAIRHHRTTAGLSQEKLAEKAGLHPTYVSMLECGVRNPTLDVAARIAKALKISLPRLVEEAQSQRGFGKGRKSP